MATRLGIGVIGLGRHWRLYRPALAALRQHLEVRGVCDQVARISEETAQTIGCTSAAGPVDLLEREDIQAVMLLDPQWYGLWPLEHACRVGKPAFCSLSVLREPRIEELAQQIEASHLPVLMGQATVQAPAVGRLRQLLESRLGPASLLRADCVLTRPPASPSPGAGLLRSHALLELLQVAAQLLGRPESVLTMAAGNMPFLTLLLDFSGGGSAQLNCWIDSRRRASCRIQVTAEQGVARATLPYRLRWRDGEGEHLQKAPRHGVPLALLQRFAVSVLTRQPPQPSFQDVCHTLTWLQAAERSLKEGRRMPIG
jgi:predicted dehydrogenase